MDGGFFTVEETAFKNQRTGYLPGCASCKLSRSCRNPKLGVQGKGRKKILLVLPAPEKKDDIRGKWLQGEWGRLIERQLRKHKVKAFEDCWIIGATNCYVKDPPNANQINGCRPMVLKAIDELKPKIIITFGTAGILSVLGHRWKKNFDDIDKWRGWCIPDRDLKAWLCPVFYPGLLGQAFYRMRENLKPAKEKILTDIFVRDLEKACSYIDEPFPDFGNDEKCLDLMNEKQAIEYLRRFDKKLIAFDYETTGLKPENEGHSILSLAVADSDNHVASFMMTPALMKLWRKILQDPSIKKIAANIKFEEKWGMALLKTKTKGWLFDVVLAAHILDQRKGITSVKFQSYVLLGVVDYDSHVDPFKKSTDGLSNGFNRLADIPVKDLLTYNGYDSLYEWKIAFIQAKQIGIRLEKGKGL